MIDSDGPGVSLFTLGVMYAIEGLSFSPDPNDSDYILGECVVRGMGTWYAREKDKNVIMTKAVWCD